MNLLKKILDLFFPPKCVICGKIDEDCCICEKCNAELKVVGKLADFGEFFSDCCAIYEYKRVRESVLRFKFGGCRSYASVYGNAMAKVIESEYADRYDIITWVPISAKRLRKRGYDQARLLAEKTAAALGRKAAPLLEKVTDTPLQSSLRTKERRKANVSGAYRAVSQNMIEDKRVLLIDDIVTTGATLSECSRTLLMAGAREVMGAVFTVSE